MIRVADYIIEKVANEEINNIFMVTGRGMLYLSDAVAKNEEINGISVHHEQAAAFAAVAYAQTKDSMGACLVSTGCAGTNTLTGVLCAWQDGIPCIFISGQNKLKETTHYSNIPIRTFGNQEADIVSLVRPITKYAVMITDINTVVYEVEKALYLAKEGRKGPVWIDVPLDLQNMRIEPDEQEHFIEPENSFSVEGESIDLIISEIEKSERPVILIGSGIRSAKAQQSLVEFAKKNNIPVAYDCAAVDIFSSDEELSIGAVASIGGSRAGNFTVQNADLLLVLGCRLNPVTTGEEYEKFAREAKVIVVDIDEAEHLKNTVNLDILIVADVKDVLDNLNNKVINKSFEEWKKKCLHWKTIFPKCEDKYKKNEKVDLYYLAECLSKTADKDAVILSDAGLEELIIPSAFSFVSEQRCIHPASQGSMGVALPAAMGAYLASEKQVIAVIGDGSVMMNIQELQTISHNNLPVKIIILNNNCYAVIRKRQKELFRTRTIGTDNENGISCPEFEKIAGAFNISYVRISDSGNLTEELNKMLQISGPVICEIIGDENQEYIANSFAKTIEKRFVQRPIEDQAPFMDRNLFLSEMIVEPIDQ